MKRGIKKLIIAATSIGFLLIAIAVSAQTEQPMPSKAHGELPILVFGGEKCGSSLISSLAKKGSEEPNLLPMVITAQNYAPTLPSLPPHFYPPTPSSPGPPSYKPISPSPPAQAAPPAPHGPSTLNKEKGVINPRTGEFFPGAFGGVINPKTGVFLPKVDGGYQNPETGEVIPKKE